MAIVNVQLGDILTAVRYLAAENNVNGRFPDAELTNYANMATIQTMVRVEWPQQTFSLTSDGTHGGSGNEYVIPNECYAVLRVYVAGQICVPTTIPILQGDPMGLSDQSAPGYKPQWMVAPFTGYPVAQQISASATQALPYFLGQRPQFYLDRGFLLGIEPPPTAGYTIAMDVFPAPTTLVNAADSTFFPQLFKEALAWRTLMYANFSMGGAEGNKDMMTCAGMFEEQITKVLIPFKTQFNRNLPNQAMPMAHRAVFRGPQRRPTGRGSRYGS